LIINSVRKLIITLSFIIIFPLVQRQWFNLYLFNLNNFTFYSFLYYISGMIFPVVISYNSLSFFTYYKFNYQKIDNKKIINGKLLLTLFCLSLISLSYLVTHYLYLNLDIATYLFNSESNNLLNSSYTQLYIFLFISFSLILKKTRIIIKKLTLITFILSSLLIWYSQINNIFIGDKYLINEYLNVTNINYINVSYLLLIDISYYFWAFVSYKNNLSDWIMPVPLKSDIFFILKIIIFYFFIMLYYSILG